MVSDKLTVLPSATALSANVPVAVTVTVSPVTMPAKAAFVTDTVAEVVPSYCLLEAVIPLTVNPFLAMFAVVVPCAVTV